MWLSGGRVFRSLRLRGRRHVAWFPHWDIDGLLYRHIGGNWSRRRRRRIVDSAINGVSRHKVVSLPMRTTAFGTQHFLVKCICGVSQEPGYPPKAEQTHHSRLLSLPFTCQLLPIWHSSGASDCRGKRRASHHDSPSWRFRIKRYCETFSRASTDKYFWLI